MKNCGSTKKDGLNLSKDTQIVIVIEVIGVDLILISVLSQKIPMKGSLYHYLF